MSGASDAGPVTGRGGDGIEAAGARVRDWAAAAVGDAVDGAAVTLAPPADPAPPGAGAALYLLELVPAPPGHSSGRPPLRLALRYLVTTWGESPAVAHRLLGALVFAALEAPATELEAELHPLPPAAWAAFGVTPRPSFFLRVPVQRERPAPAPALVRRPLVVHMQRNGRAGRAPAGSTDAGPTELAGTPAEE